MKNYEKMGTDGGLEEEMVVMVENVDIVEAAKMEEEMGAMVEKVDIEEAAQHVVPWLILGALCLCSVNVFVFVFAWKS